MVLIHLFSDYFLSVCFHRIVSIDFFFCVQCLVHFPLGCLFLVYLLCILDFNHLLVTAIANTFFFCAHLFIFFMVSFYEQEIRDFNISFVYFFLSQLMLSVLYLRNSFLGALPVVGWDAA